MRFPRRHKIFRGKLDAAAFSGVFFVLLLFFTFQSGLVMVPGIQLELPTASGFPGITNQTIHVAVTANGACFYENQITSERELGVKLKALSHEAGPLTLVIGADAGLRHSNLVSLLVMARNAGIQQTLLEVRPMASYPGILPSRAP
ncbi:MAG: hypothetical protein FJ405_03735 [Verrucomicrobia bacterium]|nr:hypothetical protein [Verrucomicrobiota bacterium]